MLTKPSHATAAAASTNSLLKILAEMKRVAVAVSGDAASLTLAAAAFRVLGRSATMYHAVSPATPAGVTDRVMALAMASGWTLDVFDAGEFADPAYLANPPDRCFFGKIIVYGAIAERTPRQIISGATLDDMVVDDPGLDAAAQHGVRHPFAEAGLDNAAMRWLARGLGLGAVADLPPMPDLASRIETGLRIDPAMLALVKSAESLVQSVLDPSFVRCQVNRRTFVVELDEVTFGRLDAATTARMRMVIEALGGGVGPGRMIQFATRASDSPSVGQAA